MSQPSVAAFFHSRKRAAVDDIFASKNKTTPYATDAKSELLATLTAGTKAANKIFDSTTGVETTDAIAQPPPHGDAPQRTIIISADVASSPSTAITTRSGRRTPVPVQPTAAASRPKRCLKRTTSDARKTAPGQQKIVKFTLAGHLSPKKKMVREPIMNADGGAVMCNLFGPKESNVDRGLKTPTKEEQVARVAADKLAETRAKLSMDDIKTRLARSGRRPEMLAALSKMNALEESRQKILNRKGAAHLNVDKHSFADQQSDRAARILGKSLKSFETIDLEVLSR